MNIRGYLKWQFEGTLSSPTFYAILIMAVGAAMFAFAFSSGFYIMMAGVAIILWDAARAWFRFSYSIYEMERREIERRLKRDE